MSPPPRLEADDYMNVHVSGYHHHKRRLPRKNPRKHYNTREGSDESKPPQRSLRSGSPNASSNWSDCKLCAAGDPDGDEDSGSNAPLIGSLGRPSFRNHRHGPQNIKGVDHVHAQTWPKLNSSAIAVDEPDSPAVNALQSIALEVPKRSNSRGLQRVSTALANTINIFRPNSTVSFAAVLSRKVSKKAEEASRRSSAHSKSLAYRDINQPRPTLKDTMDVSRTLGTPATITLRKASNVYATGPITTSMSASLTREGQHTRVVDTPASELLAFYSSQTPERRPTLTDFFSPESAEGPKSLMGKPTSTFEMEALSFRRQSKSISQFSNIPNARRCSVPAEAALTFADVHVAPGSFAVEPKPEKQPFVTTEFTRRISTVQFWSRNSVHEVIWREDETTSNSSLTASSRASQHVGHSFRSTPSPESEGSRMQDKAIKPEETKPVLPIVSDGIFTKMPDDLFRWTWGLSSASVEGTPRAVDPKSDTLDQLTEATPQAAGTGGDPLAPVLVISTSDPDFAILQQSSDQLISRSHEPSFSTLPSVQSFRPLRSRSSTAEWRKAPLVDLDDPFTGRVTQYQVQESTYFAGLGAGVGNSSTGRKERQSSQLHDASGRRWSSSPHANGQFGSVVRVGSSIWASSRKRILLAHHF